MDSSISEGLVTLVHAFEAVAGPIQQAEAALKTALVEWAGQWEGYCGLHLIAIF